MLRFGKRRKVFGPSDTHHGRLVASSKTQGISKDVTAVAAVSASRRRAPPSFIVAGKHVISS